MVIRSEQNTSGTEPEEFSVPEFGSILLSWIDLEKKYKGAIFKMDPDASKQLSELLGFNANFDYPGLRTAFIDIIDSASFCTIEIERNAKPNDIGLRYSRDRWEPVEGTGRNADTASPFVRTEFEARLFDEKMMGLIAELLKIEAAQANDFIIRVNFKDKTCGLICPESDAFAIPAGAFSTFRLPGEKMLLSRPGISDESPPATEQEPLEQSPSSQIKEPLAERKDSIQGPTQEVKLEQLQKPQLANQEHRREEMESSAKYATYSRSEVDQMLKLQAETVANALGSKISSQQRVFQEAVEKQEKSFARISDDFASKFDQTRSRLEAQSKQSEDSIRADLDTFKKDLSKELDQFRSQLNKTVLPVAKFIDEKNANPPKKDKDKNAAKSDTPVSKVTAVGGSDPGLRPILYVNLALTFILITSLFGLVVPQVLKIEQLQSEISALRSRITESQKSGATSNGGSQGIAVPGQ